MSDDSPQEPTGRPLTPEETALLLRAAVDEADWRRFEHHHELDVAYCVGGTSRGNTPMLAGW